MAPEPTAKQIAQQATWAAFRAAVAKMPARDRAALRLYLLRKQAETGDDRAAAEASAILKELCADQ